MTQPFTDGEVRENQYRTYIDKLKKRNGSLSLKLTRTCQELVAQREAWKTRAELAEAEQTALTAKEKDLRQKFIQSHEEICQTLGQALGYPWFKDDQVNFPGATEKDGVCVGDQVAETLALQAAERIQALTAERDCYQAALEKYRDTLKWIYRIIDGWETDEMTVWDGGGHGSDLAREALERGKKIRGKT